MNEFTIIFLAALACATLMRVLLAIRHVRYISAHRARVPAAFAATIALPAHQKAADYSVAKTKLGMIDGLVSAAALLALTLGGGLE